MYFKMKFGNRLVKTKTEPIPGIKRELEKWWFYFPLL